MVSQAKESWSQEAHIEAQIYREIRGKSAFGEFVSDCISQFDDKEVEESSLKREKAKVFIERRDRQIIRWVHRARTRVIQETSPDQGRIKELSRIYKEFKRGRKEHSRNIKLYKSSLHKSIVKRTNGSSNPVGKFRTIPMQSNMSVVKSSKVVKVIKSSVVGVVKKKNVKSIIKKNIKSADCCGNLHCDKKSMKMFRGTTTMLLHARTM